MSSHKGNTVFGVVGAVGCDCQSLEDAPGRLAQMLFAGKSWRAEDTIAERLDFTL